MPTFHLIIRGKVQGVFYRASARKVAISLSISGWVRNKNNGDVELLVTGTTEQLKKFIDWCRQGPTGAAVTALIENEQEETAFNSFSIKN